jgi:hypothetical protein
MDAYCVCFSGSVAKLVGGCVPDGAEEDVEECAILRTHKRQYFWSQRIGSKLFTYQLVELAASSESKIYMKTERGKEESK